MKRVRRQIYQVISFSTSSQLASILAGEIIIGGSIIIATLFLFLKLGEDVLEKEVISFDASVIHFIYSFRNSTMTSIMKLFTFLGGEIFLGTAIFATILFLIYKTYRKDAVIFSFILSFGIGLNLLLKNLFFRPRPTFLPLVHESTYSFPSGHSMNSFIFYTCVSFFIFRRMRERKLKYFLYFLSGLLIGLIGISRIYLGAHYPSDVIAGYVAGLGWFVLVLLFEKTLLFFRLFREYTVEEK